MYDAWQYSLHQCNELHNENNPAQTNANSNILVFPYKVRNEWGCNVYNNCINGFVKVNTERFIIQTHTLTVRVK